MSTRFRLRDIGATYGGLTGKTKTDFGEGDATFIPFLEVINNPRLSETALERVKVSTGERQNRVMRGDLIFNGSSETPEEVALSTVVDFDTQKTTYLNSFCFGFRLHPGVSVDPHYLSYFFRSGVGRKLVGPLAQGATRYNIAKTKFLDLELPIPDIGQQRAIADALKNVDDLIAMVERLITKKQAIKTGMMQQLLTGRTRLPGFKSEWHKTQLGEITRIKTGSRNNQDKTSGGQYPFFVRSATVEKIDSYSYDCEAILVPGEGGIGSIFHYVNGKFEVHQRVYKISDFTQGISGRFIFYYMRQFFGNHAMENSVKATVDSLRLPTFQSFDVLLPSFEEQQEIVEALDSAESELSLLQSRMSKARNIKQAMMQQLLTGHTRLPVEAAA